MKYLLLALMLSSCAVGTEPAQQTECLSHPQAEFAAGLACAESAPDCGFEADGTPTPVEPSGLVSVVCHCIGGHYACFGRQP
jgi:hypothetical protein